MVYVSAALGCMQKKEQGAKAEDSWMDRRQTYEIVSHRNPFAALYPEASTFPINPLQCAIPNPRSTIQCHKEAPQQGPPPDQPKKFRQSPNRVHRYFACGQL